MNRRTLAGLVILVLLAALLFLHRSLSPDRPVAPSPADAPEARPGPEPSPEEGASRAEPTPGPGSIRGTVLSGIAPAAARVELRALPRVDMFRPPFPDGPVLATRDAGTDGTFRFDGLALGSYAVSARADSGAWCWARAYCRARTPHARISLSFHAGESALAGRAVFQDGSPFLGFAFAYTSRRFGEMLAQSRTDGEGRFLLEGLPAGEIVLSLTKPDELGASFVAEVPSAGERVFVVDGGLREFRGQVVDDATGAPVAGARAEYFGRNEESRRGYGTTVTADEQGRFTYRSPVRKAHFFVRANGYDTAQVYPEDDGEFVVRMKRAATLTGRVVRKDDGTPVPGVPIVTYGPAQYSAAGERPVSDAEGRFAVASRSGGSALYAFGAGWVSETLTRAKTWDLSPQALSLTPGETREVVLEVVRFGAISGRLVDATDGPVAGAVVRLDHPQGWRGFHQDTSHPETTISATAADGTFSFASLVPGLPYVVRSEVEDAAPACSDEVVAAPGGTIEVLLTLPEPRWLAVRVVEKGTGTPISGASVRGQQEGYYRPVGALTGEDGTARVGPLKPGPVEVIVKHPDYTNPMDYTPGRGRQGIPVPDPAPEELLVELPKGYFVAGRILDPDGSPRKTGRVGLFAVGADARASLGLVGVGELPPTGEFRKGPVPEGRYDVVLLSGEWRDRKVVSRWTVEAGRLDLVLTVDPAQAEAADSEAEKRMVLRVLCPDGRPADGGVATVRKGRERPAFTWLRKGRFVVEGVEPGEEVWFEVRNPKDPDGKPVGGLVSGPHCVEPGTLELRLPPDRPIEGVVTGPDGKGVAGLRIEAAPVYPAPISNASLWFALPAARTDAEGRFRLVGLAPGDHVLGFDLPEDYAAADPPVVAAGKKDVTIRLAKPTTVAVRVLDAGGSPAAGAAVRATLAASSRISREAIADAKGVARLPGLDPGTTYRLLVTPPVVREDLTDRHEAAWTPAATTVALPRGEVVAGWVRSGTGAVGRATVWWKDSRDEWRKLTASATGSFRTTVLAGSRVTLCAAPAGTADRAAAGPEATVDAGTKHVTLEVGSGR